MSEGKPLTFVLMHPIPFGILKTSSVVDVVHSKNSKNEEPAERKRLSKLVLSNLYVVMITQKNAIKFAYTVRLSMETKTVREIFHGLEENSKVY